MVDLAIPESRLLLRSNNITALYYYPNTATRQGMLHLVYNRHGVMGIADPCRQGIRKSGSIDGVAWLPGIWKCRFSFPGS